MNSAVSAPQPASGAGDSKGGTAGASEAPSGTGQFANACGAPVVAEAPHATGLRLTLEFPDSAPATGTAIEGTVLLTNTSSTHVSGMTAVMPFMTLSRDGVIAWHSNGAMDSAGVVVDLAPGASMPYSVSVVPVQCGPEDELGPAFRAGLPPIAAGKLQLNAEIVFLPDSSGAEGEILVTGPPETIDLR
ncbi:MAG: hypothetical protein ABI238_06365 [Terrimesophilobacter sp.]